MEIVVVLLIIAIALVGSLRFTAIRSRPRD